MKEIKITWNSNAENDSGMFKAKWSSAHDSAEFDRADAEEWIRRRANGEEIGEGTAGAFDDMTA